MASVEVQSMPSCSQQQIASGTQQQQHYNNFVQHRHRRNHSTNSSSTSSSSNNYSNSSSSSHNIKGSSSSTSSASNRSQRYDTMFVENTVALAVITRLHRWCCQLFWLTIVCVVSCCGELQKDKSKTLADVRRTIVNNSQRRCKTVTDLEMQLLRHLTSPQTAILRPLRATNNIKKRHLSRPPSPQLFDICEEIEP